MECNICYNLRRLNKCVKCSFICCEYCISKLTEINLQQDKIDYICCVCKTENSLELCNIKDLNCLRNIYQQQTFKLLETVNDIVLVTNIILIYEVPVITNDNVYYYNNCIIALKTIQDNNTINIELYDNIDTITANNRIMKFNQNNLSVENHFIYSTNEYDYTLLKYTDFYELCNECSIDFV